MAEGEKPFYEEYWWVIVLIVFVVLAAIAAGVAYKKGMFRRSPSGLTSATGAAKQLPEVGAY